MEQNLSEKERKRRLAAGLILEIVATAAFLNDDMALAAIFSIAGLGFIFNYFTCFCGTKKAVKSFKNQFIN